MKFNALVCLVACVLPFAVVDAQCASAFSVNSVPSTFYGNTTTTASTAGSTNCGLLAPLDAGDWYRVFGTNSTLYASTCNQGTGYDTKLVLFTSVGGDCSTVNCTTIVDDVPQSGFSLCSILSWYADASQVYYIFVSGYNANKGRYQLDITATAPSLCAVGAVPVNFGGNNYVIYSNNTSGGLPPAPPTCGYLAPAQRGRFFQVPGTGGTIEVSTCVGAASTDTIIEVWTPGSCGNCYCATCPAPPVDSQTGNCETTTIPNTITGAPYFVYISNPIGASAGSFQVQFRKLAGTPVPSGTPTPVGGTSICSQPTTDLVVGTPQFSSTSLGNYNIGTYGSWGCGLSPTRRGVWYRVSNLNVGTTYYASTCNSYTGFDTLVSVFRASCGSCTCLSCVTYNDDASSNSNSALWCGSKRFASVTTFTPVSSTDVYFIFVTSPYDSSKGGAFRIVVNPSYVNPNSASAASISVAAAAFFALLALLAF